MKEELEKYITTIKDFFTVPSSSKIEFFAYYLLYKQNYEGFLPKDIASCFDMLHLDPYSNIPSYLSRNASGRNKKYLKKGSKYFLERRVKGEVESSLGVVTLPSVINSKYLPIELFNNTRTYIKTIAEQAIASYEVSIFDGCSVLTRKLLEILLIECFERHGIEANIKKPDGSFFYLSDLIDQFLKQSKWNIGRNSKNALPKIKSIGDLSAHNRRYIARKGDLEKIQGELRIVFEELIHLIDYPNWTK